MSGETVKEERRLETGAIPEDQGCRGPSPEQQNVKAVSVRPALRSDHRTTVPTAMHNSHKDNVRSSAVGKQLKQKKSSSQAQLHLPALDLFCANLRVQHHLPPLDLAWTRKSV